MPPNIVLFVTDHQRGDVLGHMGNPAAVTPNLDQLVSQEAVSFRHAFCQNPVCTPSRCSFMTGWYPHVRGHRTMHHMLHPHEGEPVLLKSLKDAGYHVWWAGKNDLIPAACGFESVCSTRYQAGSRGKTLREYGARDKLDEWRGPMSGDRYYSFFSGCLDTEGDDHYHDHDWDMIEAAVEAVAAGLPEPWCIYLSLSMPDTPYGVEEPWYSMVDRDALPPRKVASPGLPGKPRILQRMAERYNLGGWSDEQWGELRATYYGKVARTDHLFGMLRDGLRKHDAYDETSVFFFSDHGDYTGDFDCVDINQNTFEDSLTRVPLIVKASKGMRVRPGVRDAMVELIDVPATVFEMCGIEPDYTHFGRSLLPALAGEDQVGRDAVFCEGGRLEHEQHCMELESAEAQLPDSPYWPRVGLQTLMPEHTKAYMCRTRDFKYVRRLYESDEFYDLRADPGELHNVIDLPQHEKAIREHKDRLLTFLLETTDVVPHRPDQRF